MSKLSPTSPETARAHQLPVQWLIALVSLGAYPSYQDRLVDVIPTKEWNSTKLRITVFKDHIKQLLDGWNDLNLLATVLVGANMAFLQALPGISTLQRTLSLSSTLLALFSITTGVINIWRHRPCLRFNVVEWTGYFAYTKDREITDRTIAILAICQSLPLTLLMWSVLEFFMAVCAFGFGKAVAGWGNRAPVLSTLIFSGLLGLPTVAVLLRHIAKA